MAKFINIFPWAALILSLLVAILLTGPVVAFSVWLDEEIEIVDVPGQSWLSKAVVHHPVIFAWFWWIFSVVAILGSVGLIRRKKWGMRVWSVLLGILATWGATIVVSESVNLITAGLGESRGHLPNFPAMAALGAVPVGLVLGIASILLLRKLLAHQSELTPPDTGD